MSMEEGGKEEGAREEGRRGLWKFFSRLTSDVSRLRFTFLAVLGEKPYL